MHAEPGVVAGDGSLVAGLELGVRVGGVFQGDAVAALVAGLAAHRVLSSCAGAACAGWRDVISVSVSRAPSTRQWACRRVIDRRVEVGGHALELAEVVQAQAVAEPLLDLGELRADHPGDLADNRFLDKRIADLEAQLLAAEPRT
jgi:hypothetical protein